jgi:hypothetical protein
MRISVKELRLRLDILLTQVEARGIDSIDVDLDLYWSISSRELFDSTKLPANLTLGSLVDDQETLQQESTSKHPVLSHALVHAAGVLRAIGERLTG